MPIATEAVASVIGLFKGGIIGAIAYPIIDAIIYNRNR